MVQLLTAPDAEILGNYHFREVGKNRKENEKLLCLYLQGDGSLAIGQVNREWVTAWEVFKSYFGFGKLAGCTLSLRAIGHYLAERDLEEIKEKPEYQRTLETIQGIAARLVIKGNRTLQRKIALNNAEPVAQLNNPMSQAIVLSPVSEKTPLLAGRPTVE